MVKEKLVWPNIPMGGCGDDVAEVTSVNEVSAADYKYGWDFT